MDPKQPPPNKEHHLPPPPQRLESRAPFNQMFAAKGPMSTLHFLVHPEMAELRRVAEAKGWPALGFHTLSVKWLELHWTSDGWKTTHKLSSNDVPCPVVNGTFHLSGCPAGTEVEFAIHVGIACHAQGDTAGARDVADLWLNNNSKNFVQTTR